MNTNTGRVLKQHAHRSGYLQVPFWHDRKNRTVFVHRLVCEAFHGSCPADHQTLHGGLGKLVNRPDNLSWGTRAENLDADWKARLVDRNISRSTIDRAAVQSLKEQGYSPKEIAEQLGHSHGGVFRVFHGMYGRSARRNTPKSATCH